MKRGLVGAAAAAAMLFAPSAANAATQFVSPVGVDSADCTVTPCLHIQQAVNVAAPNDTISIAAGIYDTEPNNQVVVNKGLIIQGAGIGQTILDGNNASNLAVAGTLRLDQNTANPVTVSGMTIREAGSPGPVNGNANPRRLIFVRSGANAATAPAYTIDSVRFEGSGNGAADYGLYAAGNPGFLTVQNSVFVNSDFNPIVLERQQGPTDILGNSFSKASATNSSMVAFFNYNPALAGNSGFAGAQRFIGNTVDASGFSGVSYAGGIAASSTSGGITSVEVRDNTITNVGAAGIAVAITNSGGDPGTATEVQNADVTGNTITGPGATGVRFRGLVSGIDMTQNYVVGGFVRSVQFAQGANGTHFPAASEVHRNRLVGATGQGLDNVASIVDAENNWWGCNEGPNADPGCTSVTGLATTDFDPWLVLRVSAAPTSIEIGGNNSTVTADLNFNSDGVNVGSAHRDGFPVAWSTDLGTIAPPSSNLAAGVASSTLTSGAVAGTANPAATVDNETTSTAVTITDTGLPETQITSGPTGGVTIAQTSASFSFDSPNDPAATFECRLDSSNPADWTACSSPQAYANLAQGAHVFEVRAVDINNNPDPSPARGVFTVDTTPPPVVPGGGGAAGEQASSKAGACDNRIAGDAKPNDLRGTGKGDRILGFSADDTLRGLKGFDCLKGGRNDDSLNGGLAGDILQGGPGDDSLFSRDGKRDKLNCGPGTDTALVDQRDVVKGCETLRVQRRL